MSSNINHRITKNPGRKSSVAKKVWSKDVHLKVSGTDIDLIKKVTAAIYGIQTDATAGGRDNREVQVVRVDSSEVICVFNGKI